MQLMPTVRDQNGNVIDRRVAWTSDAGSVATVSFNGKVASVGMRRARNGHGRQHLDVLTFTVAQVPTTWSP